MACEPARQSRSLAADMKPHVWPGSPSRGMACGRKYKSLCLLLLSTSRAVERRGAEGLELAGC